MFDAANGNRYMVFACSLFKIIACRFLAIPVDLKKYYKNRAAWCKVFFVFYSFFGY